MNDEKGDCIVTKANATASAQDSFKCESAVLTDFALSRLTGDASRFITPYRLTFAQNGERRAWDGILSHASVSCLIYNRDSDRILLVRQFRPVVYVNRLIESQQQQQHQTTHASEQKLDTVLERIKWSPEQLSGAFTYELCAGICDDANKSPAETARDEIAEECGYAVNAHALRFVNTMRSGVGIAGALHTMFYVEVNNAMKLTSGGGGRRDEGEFIELFELAPSQIRHFLADENAQKPPGLLYALLWFMHERDNNAAHTSAP